MQSCLMLSMDPSVMESSSGMFLNILSKHCILYSGVRDPLPDVRGRTTGTAFFQKADLFQGNEELGSSGLKEIIGV